MPKQSFHIVMKTPIGERYGTAEAEWEDGKVYGTMNILKHTNTFSGQIDQEGNCHIEGEFASLLRNIPYDAEGTLCLSGLSLSVKEAKEGKNPFVLTGVPCEEKGDTEL